VLVWACGGVGGDGLLLWVQEEWAMRSPSLGRGWRRGRRKAFVGAGGWKLGRQCGPTAMGRGVPPPWVTGEPAAFVLCHLLATITWK